MNSVIEKLQSRRKMMFKIVLAAFIIALSVDTLFEIQAVDYFEFETQILFVYGLIAYKLIELSIIYYLFYYRPMLKSFRSPEDQSFLKGFEKNAKRFFMLVPQGNIVFGIISYKFSGQIGFLLLFLLFATVTLFLVKPNKALST